ncbi:MAG: hypothetical protein Q8J84_00670 [Flavobacteriaceae bacterium]|nr:hypothetical protein [Flavobacteriaceae bacterium]
MKYIAKKITYYFPIVLLVFSCQGEIDINEGENPNTNNYNSEITNHYSRIGMHDGSFDDIIDNNSCSSIVLPVSLLANGIPLNINSTSDYQLVINIFNQSQIDEDRVVLKFPFTIINKDYSKTVIVNQQQLENIRNTCNESIINNLSPISCVDIIYPIKISLFNKSIDQSTIVKINNDYELFNFMTNLSVNEVYSIQYPIIVTPIKQGNLTINSDDELKTIINSCINDTASQNPNINLNKILNQSLWKVNSLIDKNTNLTLAFVNYSFNFNKDFVLIAKNTVVQIPDVSGTWQSSYINNLTTVTINFKNDINFEVLNKKWEVTAVTSNQVNLKFQDEVYLILTSL